MTDKGPRDDRWYLNIMAPNTKGDKFAWLDPTSIYINQRAFTDLLDDLLADLETVEFDVVAGLDAMGFVLGAALAARSNVGFLPIRKAGKLCVDTDSVSFGNYSGRTQEMEMRQPAFSPGTRVLLADQWVETGGLLVRFAGPRLARGADLAAGEAISAEEDPLLPVQLRAGGRAVGGAMAWGAPQSIRDFGRESPFFGLTAPREVSVSRQILARLGPELGQRTWAALEDGTPLVTAAERGAGRVVLFHVTAIA